MEALDETISNGARTFARAMPVPFHATVIVDLAFDELMSEKECKSMASQLCHTYASNRRANRPFESLVCTSLGGRLKLQLEAINHGAYRRWRRVVFSESSYEELCSLSTSVVDRDDFKETSGRSLQRLDKNKLVYLTADSENEITELSEGETYVIGGIVDRNRHKNLCLNKAKDSHIRTARLPIGTYLSGMKTSKILTVNQVFDILLQWIATRDWESALRVVMPKRKMLLPNPSKGMPTVDVEGTMDDTGSRDEDLPPKSDVIPHVIL